MWYRYLLKLLVLGDLHFMLFETFWTSINPHILSKYYIFSEKSQNADVLKCERKRCWRHQGSWVRFPSSWSREGTSGLSVAMRQLWQRTLKIEWMASLKNKLSSSVGHQRSLKCTVFLDIHTVSTSKMLPKRFTNALALFCSLANRLYKLFKHYTLFGKASPIIFLKWLIKNRVLKICRLT